MLVKILGILLFAQWCFACVSESEISFKERSVEDCSHPERTIEKILNAANQAEQVSDVLKLLKLPKKTVVGAVESRSLQRSEGAYDHRIFIRIECALLTLSLQRNSLEAA